MNDPIKEWQRRARKEAEHYDHHSLKKAVQSVTPTDQEARTIHALYTEHEEDIEHWCEEALAKARQASDTPPVEDLKGEAYILFQRALIRYEEEKASLRTYLRHTLPGMIRDYLRSTSHETREEEPQPDRTGTAPEFDLPGLYSELVEEEKVPAQAANLFRCLHPDEE